MSNYFERVREVLIDQLGVLTSEVSPQSNIRTDLGADSLDDVEIVMALEEEFNIDIDIDDFEGLAVVEDIVKYLERVKPQGLQEG